MRAQPKPDASYASNRLTRNNKPRRPLLKVINNRPSEEHGVLPEVGSKPKDDSTSEGELSSMSDRELEELEDNSKVESKPKADEPATDAEPMSSDDEANDEAPQSSDEEKKQTLHDKLAKDLETFSSRAPRLNSSRGSQKRSVSACKGGRVRSSSNWMSDSSGEDIFPGHSQSSKRAKTSNSYSRNKSVYSRVPSSSARSAATPEKRSQETKSASKKGRRKGLKEDESDEESEPEPTFKLPPHIDIPSPPKPRTTKEASPGFIVPPIFPIDSTSNSSLGTSSSNIPQPMSLDDDAPDSPLSSPPSSISLPEEEPPRQALCPMCKKEVDPELLMRFEAQPKQRIREQQQFCASHQQNTAEQEWEAQGYPEIDWDTFDERVRKHFPDLESLLVPDCSSYYRNILDTTLKNGQAKNFRLTLSGDGLETISCGYYGTKGAQKMLQAIVDRFALRLRRLATSDHIVKTAGVAGYAQSVLVPELAVRLVKEDMGVSDDAARQILRESIHLGHKLNPAVNDIVPIPEDVQELARD